MRILKICDYTSYQLNTCKVGGVGGSEPCPHNFLENNSILCTFLTSVFAGHHFSLLTQQTRLGKSDCLWSRVINDGLTFIQE